MSQENANTPAAPEPPNAPNTPEERSRPVLLYVGVMFAVATLLLLLSFLMQQRNHEDLMRSMTKVQSIVDLELENQTLTQKLEAAETQIDTLSAALTEAEAQTEARAAEALALTALMEIRSAYEGGQRSAAQTLYDSFPGLEEHLSAEALPNIDWLPSPLWVYTQLKAQLGAS